MTRLGLAAKNAILVPPSVPSGLPSEILERRPDLRQAEQSLISANARIGQAKAAYYPSISLTGFFGGESTSLSSLFGAPARVWQFAGSAAQTVFDAGRIKSQVGVAEARQQHALAQYQLAIQNAFKDALDALVIQRKARESMEAEQLRIDALQSSMKLAQLRYDNGISSLLDVLIAERALLDAQLNRVEAQRAQLVATADLFKALGGGWDSVPGAPKTANNWAYGARIDPIKVGASCVDFLTSPSFPSLSFFFFTPFAYTLLNCPSWMQLSDGLVAFHPRHNQLGRCPNIVTLGR